MLCTYTWTSSKHHGEPSVIVKKHECIKDVAPFDVIHEEAASPSLLVRGEGTET